METARDGRAMSGCLWNQTPKKVETSPKKWFVEDGGPSIPRPFSLEPHRSPCLIRPHLVSHLRSSLWPEGPHCDGARRRPTLWQWGMYMFPKTDRERTRRPDRPVSYVCEYERVQASRVNSAGNMFFGQIWGKSCTFRGVGPSPKAGACRRHIVVVFFCVCLCLCGGPTAD